MDTTTEKKTNRLHRQRPPRRSGPFVPASNPLADARAALDRGVPPETVARRFLPPILHRRRLATLRALLAEYGADDAFAAALVELERRAAA